MPVNSNELKASVRVDGANQFRNDISGINTNLKQLDAESKKVTAEFKGQANSLEALNAKQEVLNKTLEQAQQKVQAYSGRIQKLKDEQEKIATSTEQSRDELKKLEETQSKLEKGSSAYNKMAQDIMALNARIATGEQSQESYTREITRLETAQAKAETQVIDLNRELDQNSKYLREAENSADKCATSIDKYGKETREAAEGTEKFSGIINSAAGNIIAAATQKATEAISDAAKAVVEVGSSYEASMSKVKAISGAYGSEFDQMSAKAKELGSTTKFTSTEVADGFSYMSLAGWDTKQMLDAIDGVVNLAAASEMDLGEASDMVTDYLSAFGLAASDAGKMVDMMVFAQSHSNTSTKQLGEAFGNCAANMNAAGQDMETTTAILEAMANQGTKGSEAGTALAAVMRDITSKMKNGAISIGDTSIRVQDAEGNFRSLTDILADVEKATDGMGTAQKASALQSTFTARSIKAVNQVLNEGTDNIKSYQNALEGSAGAAAKTASTMMDNYKGAVTEMQSAAEGLGVAVFEKISKPLTGVVDVATDVMGAITDALTPPAKTELEQYISDVRDEIDETRQALDEMGGVELTVNTNTAEVESYRDILLKATDAEKLSGFEKYQVDRAVNTLKGSIPELAEAYDAETGSINLTKEALDELLDSYEQQLKFQAYSDMLTEAYKKQAEAQMEAADASSASKAALQELNDYTGNMDLGALVTTFDSLSMDPLVVERLCNDLGWESEELTRLYYNWRDANKATADANDNVLIAGEGIERLNGLVEEATKEQEDNASATEENTEATADYSKEVQGAVKAGADFLTGLFKKTAAQEDSTEATEEETEAVEEDTEAVEENTETRSRAQEAGEKFAETMHSVGEKVLEAAERQKEATEKEKAALQEIREAYESNYNSIKNTLNQKLSLWDAFSGGEDVTVEKMLENLQNQNAGIKQMQDEMQAVIDAYGDELGPDLIQTLQSMGTDAANTWHHMFVTMSQDNAPELFAEMGQQWAEGLDLSDQIAKYCAGNLTAYQVATNQLGSTKVEWTGLRESVQEMMPELDAAITAAQEAGVKIPDGLAEGLQSGETSTLDAIALLTSSMRGTFQGLYEIAEASGADIPEGLSKGMEGSAEEYQAAINALTESLSQAGNEAGTAAAEEISTGLSDNTDSVETAAGDTAGAAADAVEGEKDSFKTAGQSAGSEYAAGIRYRKTNAQDAGRQLATAAKNGADSQKSSFKSIGYNMAAALAEGIRNGQSQAISAAVNMAVQAYQQAKSAIGQHSPTGIFKDELGKNIPLAVAYGIQENTRSAEEAATQMARSTFDAARYGVMVERMNSQMPAMPSPSVTVDTSPIAAMLGGQQATVINYITVNGTDDPAVFAEQLASEMKQQLRMV